MSVEDAGPVAAGLLLAAGAGRRMGGPKALLTEADGTPWTVRGASCLRIAGCEPVVVVLGAEADRAEALLRQHTADGEVLTVRASDWDGGMGRSLAAGIEALAQSSAAAALVMLVDLPDVDGAVASRVLGTWRAEGGRPDALVRATYGGRPGHPVLLGRSHWADLLPTLVGDSGAGPFLATRRVIEVSCDDLASGRDLDHPDDLQARPARGR